MLLRLNPHPQRYAWAHPDAMARLLSSERPGAPDRAAGGDPPIAELWFGTHPSGPASVATSGRAAGALIDHTGPLPWLLKLLAIGAPLSLQVHPDAARARAGFAAGRYPDDRHKPELLVAVSPVRVLAGLRPAAATLAVIDRLGDPRVRAAFDPLRADPVRGPAAALAGLLRLDRTTARALIAAAADLELVARLAAFHPDDPAVLAALLLHDLDLAPGEAIFVPAGMPHVYLEGLAVEVMANSDNVIRGGLTAKAVDVPAFVEAVHPVTGPPSRFVPAVDDLAGAAIRRFAPPVSEFELRLVDLDGEVRLDVRPPAVILGLGGRILATAADGEQVPLPPGSAVVGIDEPVIRLRGRGQAALVHETGTL